MPTLDQGVEDHATNAPEAAARTDEALDAVEDVLAIELITSAGVLRRGVGPTLGRGTGAAFAVVAGLLDEAGDSSSSEVVARVRAALTGPITRAADDAAGLGSSTIA